MNAGRKKVPKWGNKIKVGKHILLNNKLMNITLKITLEFPEERGISWIFTVKKHNCTTKSGGVLHNECLFQYFYLLFQLSSVFYPIPFYICDNSLSKRLYKKAKNGWCRKFKMNPEKRWVLAEYVPAQLQYYDCQNSSKSLLYNDLSWISRLATCQFTSCNWINLHRTSAKGNIHHSLSSLQEQKALIDSAMQSFTTVRN